jgi:glycosyltransferase involved in cell wall biosynthesis
MTFMQHQDSLPPQEHTPLPSLGGVALISPHGLPALSWTHRHGRMGGAEVQLGLLARQLAAHGESVQLIVAHPDASMEGQYLQGVRVIRSHHPQQGWPVLRFVHPRASGLWQAMHRSCARVFIASTAGMELGLAALFCQKHQRQLVFRVASDSDCDPARVMIRYARDRWLYHWGLHHAHAVWVQSQTQADLLWKHHRLPSQIMPGLVETPAHPAQPAAPSVDVLWMGNIRAVKRPLLALDVAERCPQWRFHLAGGPTDGETELFEAVKARCALHPHISFSGAVPYLENNQWFSSCRVLLNTSSVEGFPNTFLQAWAFHKPVVTLFDPDGVVQREGLGCTASSPEGLLPALESLLNNPAHYAHTQHLVAQYLRTHRHAPQLLQVYLQALQGLKSSSAPSPHLA